MSLRIGYFEHWSQPPYKFVDFLKNELGTNVRKIDYTKPDYLEPFDVVVIGQNGFNDFIENDEIYFKEYIRRGGICWFMHQDCRRWAPYFLPPELGTPILVHRYVTTVELESVYKCYMMPFIEPAGERLFSDPNPIAPEEMIYWQIRANSFGLVKSEKGKTETVKSSALSCAIDCEKWEILGSYMDPAIRKGALILQAKYGDGLYFWNQILFPEELDENSSRILSFWKKYAENALCRFERFLRKDISGYTPAPKGKLPRKRNYKMAIHLHSLEWYGGDNHLGTIRAMMRCKGIDIASIAVKDAAPYGGTLDLKKYSDDKVLFLHGQEYHPFNWTEVNKTSCHNAYHMLSIGIDADAYTPEFTRSFFQTSDIDTYLKKAIRYIHEHGGAACATHPYFDYWRNYGYDAIDKEHLTSIAGSDYEKFYADGGKITFMNSVDLFGAQRLLDNPAVNFLYIEGEPCRESIVEAVKKGHCIAAAWFKTADVTLDGRLPGDTLSVEEAAKSSLKISAEADSGSLKEIRVYSGGAEIISRQFSTPSVSCEIPLAGLPLKMYVRVEIQGDNPRKIAVTTPFYLE